MQLSITIEGHFGLTWPRWQQLTAAIERMGFAGIFRSDHFAHPTPPDADALEAMVSLTYLASHSQSLHFGTLVAPLSFRDPVFLARQAMAIRAASLSCSASRSSGRSPQKSCVDAVRLTHHVNFLLIILTFKENLPCHLPQKHKIPRPWKPRKPLPNR
jgi:hypothetical protein